MSDSLGWPHNAGMAAFDDFPPLLPHAPFLIAGVLIVFWVYMKVRLLRERLALRGDGEDQPIAAAWMHRLAGWAHTNVLLGAIALALVGCMAVFGMVA